jgi:hypothetical protein
MKVSCGHCKLQLNIPDEKIPKNQQVALPCPKCKQKIMIDTRKVEAASPPKQAPPAPAADASAAQESMNHESIAGATENDEALEILDEHEKLCLVLAPEQFRDGVVKQSVVSLHYRYVEAKDNKEALTKLRYHRFEMILLFDGFDKLGIARSPIYHHINELPMSIRRTTFLVLIGDRLPTGDNMMAYSLSANLVVNKKDVERLSVILKMSLSDHERFYKVFMDTLVEVGKA